MIVLASSSLEPILYPLEEYFPLKIQHLYSNRAYVYRDRKKNSYKWVTENDGELILLLSFGFQVYVSNY